jgi:hypothetical protein
LQLQIQLVPLQHGSADAAEGLRILSSRQRSSEHGGGGDRGNGGGGGGGSAHVYKSPSSGRFVHAVDEDKSVRGVPESAASHQSDDEHFESHEVGLHKLNPVFP